MSRRRFSPALAFLLLAAAVLVWWLGRPSDGPAPAPAAAAPGGVRPESSPAVSPAAKPPRLVNEPPAPPPEEPPSPIAESLNAPAGTLREDLAIVHAVFEAWLTNFPQAGNPVGENAEITRALVGNNPLRFRFIRPDHPAINARGELCDRWGTPFRFHQVSGTDMEIRSAGPDRRFGTVDDAAWEAGAHVPR